MFTMIAAVRRWLNRRQQDRQAIMQAFLDNDTVSCTQLMMHLNLRKGFIMSQLVCYEESHWICQDDRFDQRPESQVPMRLTPAGRAAFQAATTKPARQRTLAHR